MCGVSSARLGDETEGTRTCPPSLAEVPGLERLDVRGRRTLGALLGVVAHLRTLGQRLEAAALDRAVMHEHVLALVIRRNEAETLVVAEPLHGSCRHLCSLRGMCTAKRGGCSEATTAPTRGTALWRADARPVGRV